MDSASMKVSFCVHSWNEADALRRLVVSSLPLADLIDEWVILDHRSNDHTPEVLNELEATLHKHNISLNRLYEHRDLSAECTFADVRNTTINACRNPVVVLHDADFILGPAFRNYVETATYALTTTGSKLYAGCYTIPCIWDNLTINDAGVITDHGRVWVHSRRARILWRDAVHYEQIKDRGRWETIVLDSTTRNKKLYLTKGRLKALTPDSVVSVNVKSALRLAQRDTMTMFMQDVVQGQVTGNWLDNFAEGRVRSQGEYIYHNARLVGWKLFSPALSL